MARSLLALLACILLAGVLSACGDTAVQLQTSVTALDKDPVKPGEQHQYTVTVVNKGPGQATRVNIHVDLPAEFRYKETVSIGGDGARTQPVDAAVNSSTPDWGSWSLAAPGVSDNGQERDATVVLTFSAEAGGKPGTYQLRARASGDNTEGDASAPPAIIQLDPAAKLALAVQAQPTQAHTNDTVTYRVTVTNDGTGPAKGVGILLTMPAMLAFSRVSATDGNSSRPVSIAPIPNTSEPFIASYDIPAKSDSGPGLLVIAFQAKVIPAATAGTFPVSAQVTDCNGGQVSASECSGEVVAVRDASPVTIFS